jgi:hypothetical protein
MWKIPRARIVEGFLHTTKTTTELLLLLQMEKK